MRAAIYVRVSTSEQALEGYSISAQTSILKDYAKTYKYDVIKIYQDAGISGKNIKDRPSMCDLLEDAKQKKFDIVLVWKLSRLSRSLLDLLAVVDLFTQNEISFQSYTEKFDTSTPMGKMLLQMLGSIAEFERNTIAENVKMGLNERFKRGYSKGAIPFGYTSENKKAVIVPEQAEVVKRIYNIYIESEGRKLSELAEYLNQNGFRTRTGNLWDRTIVKDLIKNNFYAGYVRTGFNSRGIKKHENAAIIKGQHEPIIDDDTFEKAMYFAEKSKIKNIKNYDNPAAFSGLLICPFCGSKLYSYKGKDNHYINKNNEQKLYPVYAYRCNKPNLGTGTCKGLQVSYSKIDKYVVEILNDYVNNKKYYEASIQIEISSCKEKDSSSIDIDKEIKKQKALKDKYFKAFEMSNIDDLTPYMEKIDSIYKKIQELESIKNESANNKTAKLDNYQELFGKIKDFKSVYNNLSLSSQKDLIRELVTKIYITENKKIKSIELTNGDVINL